MDRKNQFKTHILTLWALSCVMVALLFAGCSAGNDPQNELPNSTTVATENLLAVTDTDELCEESTEAIVGADTNDSQNLQTDADTYEEWESLSYLESLAVDNEHRKDKLLTEVRVYWNGGLYEHYSLEYNNKRQLSEAVYAMGSHVVDFSFIYDQEGRLLKADRGDFWLYFGNDEYLYDSAGKLACHKYYWGGGDIPHHQYNYEYDESGMLIKEEHLLPNAARDEMEVSSVYSYLYIYDTDGRVIERQQYTDGEDVSVRRYLYDSADRVQSMCDTRVPKSMCNPQGNADLIWDEGEVTSYCYGYAPFVVQESEGRVNLCIQDSVGEPILSLVCGKCLWNIDADGFLISAMDVENEIRYELIYSE